MDNDKKFSPNQTTASDPTKNIWVQANAGTGKTSVLIQRLLRILFRNECYNNKTAPGILCLTYTNAAAGEMRNRILAGLREWSMVDDEKLTELLDGIAEKSPATAKDLAYARRVFFMYIDNPDILKIKTIHSFCEEILHRFPLEAGISPAWSLVSDSAQTVLLEDAFERMVKKSCDNNTNCQRTADAFFRIVDVTSEYFLNDLRKLLFSRYRSFFLVDNVEKYREYFIDKTRKILQIDEKPNMEPDVYKLQNIIEYAQNCVNSSKKPAKYMQKIVTYVPQYIENTIDFEEYKDLYLTDNGEPNTNIMKHNAFVDEALRVRDVWQYLLNEKVFKNTVALFDLALDFAENYREIKKERNLLDFEDLILLTQNLFSKPDVMGWVLSQLDVSLKHILVDEAQDTSPQQWNVLRMLAGDFFTEGDTADNKSLFVVGDTKQSIYGFQNADPEAFLKSRQAIAEQIKQNYRTIQEIGLDQSFRSVEPILKTVDYFFDNPDIIQKTGFHNNKHACYRKGEHGFVEMHNLSRYDDAVGGEKNKRYVQMIANKIEDLITKEGVEPKDILVLLQNRLSFADPLADALKKKNIDIAGSDRIKLPKFPAIKDMLHLIRFCDDNTNDYSLCCVLKSPFYRLKEADIYKICKIRNDATTKENIVTVFDVLRTEYQDIYNDLSDTIEHSKSLAPYSFFTYVLNKNNNRERIVSALGKQVIDPLEEFLTMCLAYERTMSGTLHDFIKWFITGDSVIKRDMDASQGVRIMSVHGSKGLASPIVFLIDTVYFPKQDPLLNLNYLHDNSMYDLWLWNTGKSKIVETIANKNKQDDIAEYYRLLYVAMTRTRDKLYIYGCDKDRMSDLAWHPQLWGVLSTIEDARIDDDTIRITNDTKFE